MAEDWRDEPGQEREPRPAPPGYSSWPDPLAPRPAAPETPRPTPAADTPGYRSSPPLAGSTPAGAGWPPPAAGFNPAPGPSAQRAPSPPLPPGAVVVAGRTLGPAGFGPRLLAFLLDWLVLIALFAALTYAVDLPRPDAARELKLSGEAFESFMRGELPRPAVQNELEELARPQRFLGWLNVALCAGYFILFHGLAGATLGKAACGLSVRRPDGSPLGVPRAALRYLGYFVLAKVFYGTFTMLFDQQRRAVHDFLADSNVFRELRWR